MKLKFLAIALIVFGVGATLAGLFGQVFLAEDEGHHDGRVFTYALESVSGADELVVESNAPNIIDVLIERAGQPIDSFDEVHGAQAHVYAVARDLTSFTHVASAGDGLGSVEVPGGELRVVAQVAPSGGPDLLELGTTVEVAGDLSPTQNITDTDTWTSESLSVTRQGFDFALSEPWNGDDVFDGPALLSLFRVDDLAFTHGHAEMIGDNRFSFAIDLPGSGEYLAAVEFEQNDELVTALFRFTV